MRGASAGLLGVCSSGLFAECECGTVAGYDLWFLMMFCQV